MKCDVPQCSRGTSSLPSFLPFSGLVPHFAVDIVTTVAIGEWSHLLPPCRGVVWTREVQPEVRGTFRYVGYSINKASAAHILEMITWELSSWCLVPRAWWLWQPARVAVAGLPAVVVSMSWPSCVRWTVPPGGVPRRCFSIWWTVTLGVPRMAFSPEWTPW